MEPILVKMDDKNNWPQCNAFSTEHPALGNSLGPPPEHRAQRLAKEGMSGAPSWLCHVWVVDTMV